MVQMRLTGVSLILPAWLLVGCQDPAFQENVDHREANLRRTAADLSALETGRVAKMQATIDLLADQHERDIANNRQNPAVIRQWWDDDLQQWEEAKPVHRQRIAEQLEGDPANIKRTLPEIVD